MNMNVHSAGDVRVKTGYYRPGESVENASVGTRLKNWLAKTFIGKIFKMDPPKCLFVRDSQTGRHIATDITSARFGRFVKVDLSGTQPTRIRDYTPPQNQNLTLEERGSGEENVGRVQGKVNTDQELVEAKNRIAEGFDNDFWNRDQMTVALYAKMVARKESGGAPIRAFVAEFDPGNPKGCELGKILDGIKSSLESGGLKEGQRFQIAVQNGAHWTAIDAKIIDGKPHFFVMDAAQQSTANLSGALREAFPECTIYEFNDREVGQIQFDDNSCSRFTLDQLSVMSRDETLFERLAQGAKEGGFRNLEPGQGGGLLMVPAKELPAGTLRMLQSHTMLDKLDDETKDRIASPKKGMTEFQQALGSTVVDFERGKIMNTMVDTKKESYTEKSLDFLDRLTLEQFNKIVTARSGEGLLF
ncbi:hypothetical protein [Pseudothauera rhizosphaerae]|uniref:Uncharacterized protein n=1 Tax=Pseudothauera rhizosphaerae TaxID=2565932 RepID=A0A4S4AFW1_9RHOO|nr:hypothetical protein [Pseudothauera rhizosphaerae]THF58095.1 hypothetical protein E6O51_17290 [Pseudothauera rhizosphaerae]